jgi:hypothetical protein
LSSAEIVERVGEFHMISSFGCPWEGFRGEVIVDMYETRVMHEPAEPTLKVLWQILTFCSGTRGDNLRLLKLMALDTHTSFRALVHFTIMGRQMR